ncbi:MAG: triose-phosphate isomerase [Candidatus Paceibacterota bacterium]|nr:triose-phosphate isomerase [Candidatus Paceibacterota bacterium]HQM34820.1 triose-phosphate isomerase [Candidatus Paceibacterota bacterium]
MKTIVANFKMNPATSEEAKQLLTLYKEESKKNQNVNLIIAPPFLYLETAKNLNLQLAAQNCFYEDQGAFTGEISPLMLKNFGVQYVILGHSERRQLGETNEIINKKVRAVIQNNLTPILCIGETQQERQAGETEVVLKNQLEQALSSNTNYFKQLDSLFIAYEPVWAIGTGDFCDPIEVSQAMKFIQNTINAIFAYQSESSDNRNSQSTVESAAQTIMPNLTLIYGGSVDSKNINDFLKQVEINGVLVGGASIKKEELVNVITIANSY